jgi:hypothetical protein
MMEINTELISEELELPKIDSDFGVIDISDNFQLEFIFDDDEGDIIFESDILYGEEL